MLGSLASAILDLGLPAIRSWLRNRIGPAADVAAVRSDGALVHLSGVVIPLGQVGRIALDRAAVTIVRERGEKKSQRVRLHSFRGVLVIEGAASGDLRAEVTFGADERPAPDTWACGRLLIDHASWAPLTARDPRAALRGEAHLTITSEAWSLDDGQLDGPAASATLVGKGQLEGAGDQDVELRIKDVDAEMLAALVTVLGLGDAPFHIPVRTHARGTARLTVRDAKLDVGGSVELLTEHSSVRADPLRFDGHAFDGTVIHGKLTAEDARIMGLFTGSVTPRNAEVSAELELSGPADAWLLAGTLRTDRLTLVRERPDVEPAALDLERVTARVRVHDRALEYSDLHFHAYAGVFLGRGTVHFGKGAGTAPPLHLDIRGASPELAIAVSKFFGGPANLRVAHDGERAGNEIWLAPDATLEGSVDLEADLRLAVRARLTHDVTALTVLYASGVADPGRVEGVASLADIALASPDGLPFQFHDDDAVHVELSLASGGGVSVGGTVKSPRLHIAFDGAPEIAATDVSAEAYADARGVVWRNLNARLHGGWVSSMGLTGDLGTSVVVEIGDVDLAEVSLPSGEALERWVRGRLHAEVRVARGASDGWLDGRGSVRLTHGAYPALEELTPLLKRYGLPKPDAAATGEASANMVIRQRGVSFLDAIVRLTGATASGALSVGFDGMLQGRFDVRVEDSYLRRSKLLVLPSVLAEEIHVPVKLAGKGADVKVDADLVRTLGRFVEKNRLTDIIDDAVDDVMSLVTGKSRPSAAPPEASPLLADEASAGAAPSRGDVANMIAARAPWDEIAARVRAGRK